MHPHLSQELDDLAPDRRSARAAMGPHRTQACAVIVKAGALGSLVALIASAALYAPGASAAPNEAVLLREQAMLEYDAGHYAQAAAGFRRAAEQGEPGCAELLTLMYRFSDALYASQIPANPAESARWATVAARERAGTAIPRTQR